MATKGRKSRGSRLTSTPHGGSCATSSQDYMNLVDELFQLSADWAEERGGGNGSLYTPAAIPMLFSAFRCLLIELNSQISLGRNPEALEQLAKNKNDVVVFSERYSPERGLLVDLELLHEIRNEIVHPATLPEGTPHNTPAYLIELRQRGLLQSTGKEDSDYIWSDQLRSHRLLIWAYEVIANSAIHAINSHDLHKLVAQGYTARYEGYIRGRKVK